MTTQPNVLNVLLHPVSADCFLNEYWGQKTLFLEGDESKITDLLGQPITWADYHKVAQDIAESRHHEQPIRAASLLCSRGAMEYRDRVGGFLPLVRVEANLAPEYLASGIPVTLPNIHWFHEGVARFMQGLTCELGGLRNLEGVFATNPAGGSGVASHFDSFPTMHLQLVGRKRWTVSKRPEYPWPLRPGVMKCNDMTEYIDQNGQLVVRELDAEERVSYDVSPGDIIFLPAGTWHEAHPFDEDTLGLELLFNRLTMKDLLSEVVQERLARLEIGRRDVPLYLRDQNSVEEIPDEVSHHFTQGLHALQDVVKDLENNHRDLHQLWKSLANGFIGKPDIRNPKPLRLTGTETGTEKLRTESDAFTELGPETKLCVSRRGPLSVISFQENEKDRLLLFQQEHRVSIDAQMSKLGTFLVRAKTSKFRADEACKNMNLEWELLRSTLRDLLRKGFLEVV